MELLGWDVDKNGNVDSIRNRASSGRSNALFSSREKMAVPQRKGFSSNGRWLKKKKKSDPSYLLVFFFFFSLKYGLWSYCKVRQLFSFSLGCIIIVSTGSVSKEDQS